jgi:hypothetical protein
VIDLYGEWFGVGFLWVGFMAVVLGYAVRIAVLLREQTLRERAYRIHLARHRAASEPRA